MAKHTDTEMEQLSLDELKKFDAEQEQPIAAKTVAAEVEEDDAPETFVARRELDMGEGAGVEVFEAEGATREEALEALADKIADAKLNSTKKIRLQEAELKDLRARNAEQPKPKTLSADDEYVLAQEFQKTPGAAFKKMFKEFTGYEVEDFTSVKQAADAFKAAQQSNSAIATFVATHSDYEDDPAKGGGKNGELMKMKLAELGLQVTSENLSKAYSSLKQSGLLLLKSEEAHADTDDKTKEPDRIVQPKVEATPLRTKKTSTIGTHSRVTTVPVNTEPSEDELYKMPMDKLKQLANKQLGGR